MSSKPNITLIPATAADLPFIVDLQFQCFSHTVLIEMIYNPDTPEARAAVLADRLALIKEDKGVRVVKAVTHTPNDAGIAQEKLVGFCIFHLPVPSSEKPGQWIAPTPLRKLFDEVPAKDTKPNVVSVESTPGEEPVQVQTDIVTGTTTTDSSGAVHVQETTEPTAEPKPSIRTLLPDRKRTLNEYVAKQERFASTYPPPIGYVRYMCVHPEYRRYGIGSKLMAWGCKLFDEHGFDAYLEATAEGEPMYEKFGFEKFGEQKFQMDTETGVEAAVYPCMWRNVQGTNTC